MNNKLTIKITTLPHHSGLALPAYQSESASGMDLSAAIEGDLVLAPLQRALIPSGIAIELPRGFEAQIRPRSGLAAKNGITVLNTPGTIDSDYRGEIKIILINLGTEDFVVRRGMRIAQMVIAPVIQAILEPALALSDTLRGEGGFGHSGSD